MRGLVRDILFTLAIFCGMCEASLAQKPLETFRNRYGHVLEKRNDGTVRLKREKALTEVLGDRLSTISGLYDRYVYIPEKISPESYGSRSFTVNYKETGTPGDSLRLEIELPLSSAGPVPFIVWIHGGGWHGGSPESMRNESRFFANEGFASFRVQYRLRPEAMTNEEQLQDIADAVSFIKKNAAEFNVVPDSYVYIGGSAGGQLALLSGIRDKDCSGIVPLYAVYDIKGFYDFLLKIGQNKGLGQEIKDFFCMDTDEYVRYNPCDAVCSGMPPVMVVHGTGDSTAPYSHCEEFMAAMDSIGAVYEKHVFELYEHNFTGRNASDAYEEVQLSILEFLDNVLN